MILPDPENRISRSAVWYWMFRYTLFVVAAAVLSITPAVLLPISRTARAIAATIIVIALAGGLALAIGVPLWRYAVHRWEVAGAFIVTRSGAVFRDWRIVPLHRVQTVEVSQGILERVFGVARLVIRTASYAGSTEIAGMDAGTAREVAAGLTDALAAEVRAGHADDGA